MKAYYHSIIVEIVQSLNNYALVRNPRNGLSFVLPVAELIPLSTCTTLTKRLAKPKAA